ncbi:beta-galactosidase [Natronolimnobius baerhuensis]|uniref:beta-galactosidase n=1 Tax=Natronolimnobius baerhuensis TaxID=253108 RepID=A0A202EB81_9EURY|nr:beta-galactosidase [Natronolimnobius baerhuensis]OVE85502.1 beta-galactosidase [Natronolimnobius baerhuensis]
MNLGVCYFPEHWPRERWETDIEAMAEAGLEYVRMAEFSWAAIEPERGEFDFEWLDEVVDLIGEYDMQAVLCTPTATPPKWLVDEHPEIRQETFDGTTLEFGSRRHYCFNSDAFREETDRIISEMAGRYADNPAVAGWQTDNEFGCHETVRCYCDDCEAAFREWVAEKYNSIEDLNESWGNRFWSQQYNAFDEIDAPGPTPDGHHPARLLEYARFSSDSVVDYNAFQADLLREIDADWFVTHNFMGHFSDLNAFDVSDDLEMVAWDSYPTGFVQEMSPEEPTVDELRAGNPDQLGLNHDLYRSARDRPFWVMEQQPGDINWPAQGTQPADGAMRLWAHHASAHGADGIVYFRWQRCLEGQEQYHAGLRKQDGSPDRGYHDATQAADELAAIGGEDGVDHVDAPVALLFDYDSCWALEEQPHAPDFDYWQLLESFHGALRARGVQVDVVPPTNDLEGYDAVVAPALHLVTDEITTRLEEYVEAGGELLLGPRTGVKDAYNKLRPALQPGPLTDLVGATVEQHDTLPERIETVVSPVDGDDSYGFRTWAEWLEADDADPLFTYEMDGIEDGHTAAVRNSVGDGTVVYCGVWPDADLADELVRPLLARADVDYTERLPDGLRINHRDGRTWVTNFTSDAYRLETGDDTDWLVGDSTIDAFDVAVADDDLSDEFGVEPLE